MFIDAEIFFSNFAWLSKSELKNILTKLENEKAIEYEWHYKGMGLFGQPYNGRTEMYSVSDIQEARDHEFDFVGISCKPNVEKLQKYLEEANEPSIEKQEYEKFPNWEGTQILEYRRAERKLIVDGIPYIVPKNPAIQREVLLELAVKNGGSWVAQARWMEVLEKEQSPSKADDENRAFRGVHERLKGELEKTLKQSNVLEWKTKAVRIRKKSN
ncbi:MAG: hypothetical protein Greene041619_772 [Candidatus Peregrinibacteria bacterium Greene0416_19]|nr:MAG: hypothetical protein Greene041619_772 [Candidatus Peregrinibacteria bacterium Greene0416_19]